MKRVKLYEDYVDEQVNHSLGHFNNDFIAQQAEKLGMSREEYVAHYASPTIGSGIDESKDATSDVK